VNEVCGTALQRHPGVDHCGDETLIRSGESGTSKVSARVIDNIRHGDTV